MGVEDGGFGLAHLMGHLGAKPLDVAADGGQGPREPAPVGRGVVGACIGNGDGRDTPRPGRADADPGRSADRRVPPLWRHHPGRVGGHSWIIEATRREGENVVQRRPRLRSEGPDLDLVTGQRTEGEHRRQARRGHPRRTCRQVAHAHARLEQAHGLDQPRGGPGVQAVRVRHGERPDEHHGPNPPLWISRGNARVGHAGRAAG